MSTTREKNGETRWTCDDCGTDAYSGTLSFADAWADLKRQGWIARKDIETWMHYCPDCHGETA